MSILLAQVVATPLVQILSLMAIGIPARGGSFSPFWINLSIVSACENALCFVVQMYELIIGSLESIFKKKSYTNSVTEIFLPLISFLKELKSISKFLNNQTVNGSSILQRKILCLIL